MKHTPSTYTNRIVFDPTVLTGKPVIKGTRIPVELVLKRLAQDLDMKTIFAAYPRLTEEDVKACLAYAQEVIEGEEVYSLDIQKQTNTHTHL